jgi:D-lactate dehydrogenase
LSDIHADGFATLGAPGDELLAVLNELSPGVRAGASDRLAAAHDASPYVLTPRAVVTATDLTEIVSVLQAARLLDVGVTFRSGGTSLSGQAGTEGVLINTRRNFRRVEVLEEGARVRSGPGATVRAVNLRLARYGRKLGPDPASEIACTVGGVIANNSSGMVCGVETNTYRTLDSALLVLPSGTIVDTGRPDADDRLRSTEPALHAGLLALRDRVRANPASVSTIRELFAIKNTMGYAVNALLDYERAIDILEHLVVGSEGTLAFVAEATFRTVPLNSHFATGLLFFPDLVSATAALPLLVAAGFATIELMDATSLRVAQRDPEATHDLLGLDVVEHAALLVEYQEATDEDLEHRLAGVPEVLGRIPLVTADALSTDPARRAALWRIRKGLFTLVAGSRQSGTSALLEDIAVPVERLSATCTALTSLFEKHGYEDAVVFGHAKDGNVHFLLNERFDDPLSLARYEAFTEDMVALVLGQGGTLKAEHGTGRIMAPFVRRQYGDELYDVMREVKRLVDPHGLLNPGVLLTDDPDAHISHLKTTPTIEEEVDRCVECGYCEPVCPSRDLTFTPRERIVLRREIAIADAAGDTALASTLRTEYAYDGVDTCAVDGMCQTACPVLINTGDLVRRLRAEEVGIPGAAVGRIAAHRWATVTRAGSIALSAAAAMPPALPRVATTVLRRILGRDRIPLHSEDLPSGGARRPASTSGEPLAVYFASCTNTMFGSVDGGRGVARSFLELCARAGVDVATPSDLPDLCCGTPWKSKGLERGYEVMRDRVLGSLSAATRNGEIPVVCDASSCTEGLELLLAGAQMEIRVVDAVAFVAVEVLPRLPDGERIESVTLHPTCSSVRLGLDAALLEVASAAAERVVIPDDWGCCAFAGDRGMLHPELTASATAPEADAVRRADSRAHVSLNRTCELGMTRATGRPYSHVLELLASGLPPIGSEESAKPGQ